MGIGYFYDVITNGFGQMPDYAAQVAPADRWAIAAYIRTLQFSHRAPVDVLTGNDRRLLEEAGRPAASHGEGARSHE